MNKGIEGEAHVQPGDVLAGKYRVERVLGQGGMGVVVAAHHLQLDETVALKFLLPEAVGDPEAIARFLREARAAAKIKNEHVARVSDVGQLENGSPYIVMEYLDGSDLAEWLVNHPAMPIEQVVDFVLQACEALADAHALGIIHRDLKPANLFCTQRTDGHLFIKLLDFGISKMTTPGAGSDMTKSSAVLGSPLYMSPEQMQGSKSLDVRTDVWSLGVILYELLTGRPPFDHDVMTALAVKIVNEPAPPLRELRPDASPELAQIVARCLAKNRAGRFATVGELAVALERFGPKHAHTSVERVVATLRKAAFSSGPSAATTSPATPFVAAVADLSELTATTPQTNVSWGQTTGRPQARRKVVGIFAALVVAGVVAVTGTFVLRKPALSGTATGPSAAIRPSLDAAPVATQSDSVAAGSAPLGASMDAGTPPSTPAPSVAASSVPSPPGRSSAASGSKPTSHARPTPAPAAPKVSCSPPFVVDANGERKYKPECL